MDNYDILFKKYKPAIDKYVSLYGYLEGCDDYRQNLMIAIWEYVESKKGGKDCIEKLFASSIKYLSMRLFFNYAKNKQIRFESSFEKIFENTEDVSSNKSIYTFDEIINTELNDNQKKIVYAIDLYGVNDKFTYKDIGKKVGLTPRTVYYCIEQIRYIFGKKFKNMQK